MITQCKDLDRFAWKSIRVTSRVLQGSIFRWLLSYAQTKWCMAQFHSQCLQNNSALFVSKAYTFLFWWTSYYSVLKRSLNDLLIWMIFRETMLLWNFHKSIVSRNDRSTAQTREFAHTIGCSFSGCWLMLIRCYVSELSLESLFTYSVHNYWSQLRDSVIFISHRNICSIHYRVSRFCALSLSKVQYWLSKTVYLVMMLAAANL